MSGRTAVRSEAILQRAREEAAIQHAQHRSAERLSARYDTMRLQPALPSRLTENVKAEHIGISSQREQSRLRYFGNDVRYSHISSAAAAIAATHLMKRLNSTLVSDVRPRISLAISVLWHCVRKLGVNADTALSKRWPNLKSLSGS